VKEAKIAITIIKIGRAVLIIPTDKPLIILVATPPLSEASAISFTGPPEV